MKGVKETPRSNRSVMARSRVTTLLDDWCLRRTRGSDNKALFPFPVGRGWRPSRTRAPRR